MSAGAAVDDPWAAFAEGIAHVRGLRGTHVAERIGARRGERTPREAKHLADKRMGRDTHGDRILAGGDEIGDDRLATKHDCQRTRPEVSEFRETRIRFGDFGERSLVEHVDDERIEEWAALDREDLAERRGIGCIGGEAIDRLSREGYAGALTQELGRT